MKKHQLSLVTHCWSTCVHCYITSYSLVWNTKYRDVDKIMRLQVWSASSGKVEMSPGDIVMKTQRWPTGKYKKITVVDDLGTVVVMHESADSSDRQASTLL